MSKGKYEAEINNYYFVMNDDTIEVWGDCNGEHPESYIYVSPGSVKNEKDFHWEVSDWFIKNLG